MELWSDLFSLSVNFSHAWCAIGDFNALLGEHEKTRCVPAPGPCREFRRFINDCLLSDIPTRGAFYTWYNRRSGSNFAMGVLQIIFKKD